MFLPTPVPTFQAESLTLTPTFIHLFIHGTPLGPKVILMGPHHSDSCFCLRAQQQQLTTWGNLTLLLKPPNFPQVCRGFKVPEQYINRKRPGPSIDEGPVNLKLEQESTTWATLPTQKHPWDYQYRCPSQMFKEMAKSTQWPRVWDSIGPYLITLCYLATPASCFASLAHLAILNITPGIWPMTACQSENHTALQASNFFVAFPVPSKPLQ